jgi:hypothetical protein
MRPVRLPAAATITLPRGGLIGLCLLYILPGIIRRDPWKTDDAAGFGVMWTMAHGTMADWLSPNIVGLPMPNDGPLAFWIGAVLIKLFGWVTGGPVAVRVSAPAELAGAQWVQIPDDASSIVIRDYVADPDTQVPATLHIARLGEPTPPPFRSKTTCW